MRNVTLTQLRADIAAQADFVGATGRYPDATVNRFINQSIQRFREKLSTEGATHFLLSTSGTLAAGAVSPCRPGVCDSRSAVVALTHDPKLDDLALMEALKSDAFYVGAIGSRSNDQKRRERRLAQRRRVGAHVRDIAPLVEPLGDNHGLLSGKSAFARRFLLKL